MSNAYLCGIVEKCPCWLYTSEIIDQMNTKDGWWCDYDHIQILWMSKSDTGIVDSYYDIFGICW